MQSKEERLLDAVFSESQEEPGDNYLETATEKVSYAEYLMTHSLEPTARAIQRLSRLHRLLIVSEKDGQNKLPDIITYNELRIALSALLHVENDVKEVVEMLTELYRATKPEKGAGNDKAKKEAADV